MDFHRFLVSFLVVSRKIKVRHLNIGPNMVFYLIDRCEVVVIAVMHCKQSSYVINLLRYAIRR